MMDVTTLKFDESGLIPAIVVDAKSKKVLTLAYMNRESLEISIREKRTCFWSRSRQTLWRKGETSGNVQLSPPIVTGTPLLSLWKKRDLPAILERIPASPHRSGKTMNSMTSLWKD